MKNKYIVVSMAVLVTAIALNQLANISDFAIGMIFGVAIGIGLLGAYRKRKSAKAC